MECTVSDNAADQKPRDPRTNTLLSVAADLPNGSGMFRVRDISSSGALLEGTPVPTVGDAITVHRHDRELAAHVVWVRGNRCGVCFDSAVDVSWFIGRGKAGAAPAHQARVDAIQAQLRAPGVRLGGIADPEPASSHACLPVHEIGYVMRLLESLVDDLTADAYILGRYGQALQKFDVAQQTLQKVQDALGRK